jgi:hypothetical protein
MAMSTLPVSVASSSAMVEVTRRSVTPSVPNTLDSSRAKAACALEHRVHGESEFQAGGHGVGSGRRHRIVPRGAARFVAEEPGRDQRACGRRQATDGLPNKARQVHRLRQSPSEGTFRQHPAA